MIDQKRRPSSQRLKPPKKKHLTDKEKMNKVEGMLSQLLEKYDTGGAGSSGATSSGSAQPKLATFEVKMDVDDEEAEEDAEVTEVVNGFATEKDPAAIRALIAGAGHDFVLCAEGGRA